MLTDVPRYKELGLKGNPRSSILITAASSWMASLLTSQRTALLAVGNMAHIRDNFSSETVEGVFRGLE